MDLRHNSFKLIDWKIIFLSTNIEIAEIIGTKFMPSDIFKNKKNKKYFNKSGFFRNPEPILIKD